MVYKEATLVKPDGRFRALLERGGPLIDFPVLATLSSSDVAMLAAGVL